MKNAPAQRMTWWLYALDKVHARPASPLLSRATLIKFADERNSDNADGGCLALHAIRGRRVLHRRRDPLLAHGQGPQAVSPPAAAGHHSEWEAEEDIRVSVYTCAVTCAPYLISC